MTWSACGSWFLALVFLRSAWWKLRDREGFVRVVESYSLPVPARWAAMTIAGIEAAIGMGLILPVIPINRAATLAAAAFIVLASITVMRRYARGERRFACGCGSDHEEEDDGRGIFLRNVILFSFTVWQASAIDGKLGIQPSWPGLGGGVALLLTWDLLRAAILQEGRVRDWKVRG